MKKLDWAPDNDDGFVAASRIYHDEGSAMEYVVRLHLDVWAAGLEGAELARGPLLDCLNACEKSEAQAGGNLLPDASEPTPAGQRHRAGPSSSPSS